MLSIYHRPGMVVGIGGMSVDYTKILCRELACWGRGQVNDA